MIRTERQPPSAPEASGRIVDILVDEGDFVRAGQLLARMDTAVLEAQRKQAEAQLQQALIGIEVAKNQVTQREAGCRCACIACPRY